MWQTVNIQWLYLKSDKRSVRRGKHNVSSQGDTFVFPNFSFTTRTILKTPQAGTSRGTDIDTRQRFERINRYQIWETVTGYDFSKAVALWLLHIALRSKRIKHWLKFKMHSSGLKFRHVIFSCACFTNQIIDLFRVILNWLKAFGQGQWRGFCTSLYSFSVLYSFGSKTRAPRENWH